MEKIFTRNLPTTEIQVGDNVRAMVTVMRSKKYSNNIIKHPRNGTVKQIIGNIVRIECRRGGTGTGGLIAINLSDITDAWGYR